ncbi:unnamed protein product [Orchesella dallaii]|uniref:Ionotropic glutamate receptor C-terminal domain-containing protein n=1 Tax=Orchesella dallaii TaxID=48710 RepID=A0ABP1RLX1_9HEXA
MFVSTGRDGKKGSGGTGIQIQNGTWIGVTGDLILGRADLGIATVATPKRIHFIDFTISFYAIGCLAFVTNKPTEIYSPGALLWPFDILMWISILGCILISLIFLFLAIKIMQNLKFGIMKSWAINAQIGFLFTTLLEQSAPLLPISQTLRCFASLWLLFAMVVTNAYRSKLVTFMAFPVFSLPPKTFEHLAFSDYEIGFMKIGDSAYNTLAASNDQVYRRLVGEMEIFKGVNLECVKKVVREENFACIGYDFALTHLRERNLSSEESRKLRFAPATTYNICMGLATRARSIYRINFGKVLSYTRPFHLAKKWTCIGKYIFLN